MDEIQKVTLQSIADKLSVSKALVSKALSNDTAVNEVTREVIWKTAEELGYRIKSAKKAGSPAGTGNLALLMPRAYLDDPEYWGKIIKGIDKELSSQNYSMLLSSIDVTLRASEGMPSSIAEDKVDGVIVLGQLPDAYTDQLKKKLPVVLVDPSEQDPDVDMVLANNYQGAYQAANDLLGGGHRRLAFVGDADSTWSFAERRRGFIDAVNSFNAKRGEAAASFAVIEGMGVSGSGMYTKPSFPADLLRQLKGDHAATALFCANDLIAYDSIGHFAGWGLECPRDVSIVGFDNLSLAELKEPQLTTVSVPMEEIGSKAARLVLNRIAEPGKLPELVMISTTLVQRKSTAAREE